MSVSDLCDAYLSGRSLPSLAREHRKAHQDIAYILRASGVTIRPRGRQPTPARERARSMLRDGAAPSAVAEATGLTRDAVLGIRWAMRRAS